MASRSAMFARSDIHSAAEDFIEEISLHVDGNVLWEAEDKADLAEQLTEKAFEILRDPEARF